MLAGCGSTNTGLFLGDYLKILDEPETFHSSLAKLKLTTEEYGRLVKDYYKTQDKDSTFQEFEKNYAEIQKLANQLVNDITLKIEKNVNVKYSEYENRVEIANQKLEEYTEKYTSEVSGLSPPKY